MYKPRKINKNTDGTFLLEIKLTVLINVVNSFDPIENSIIQPHENENTLSKETN